MKTLSKQHVMRKAAGYTIDQTILIVAVIAILITLVIASVGWDLLQRTGGTKLASQFRQIEDANGQFLARQGVWPTDAVDVAGCGGALEEASIMALVDDGCVTADYQADHRNLLPGFEVAGNVAQHAFGAGGSIEQAVLLGGNNTPNGGQPCGTSDVMVVTMASVPQAEITRADENIDGGDGNASGRLQWGAIAAGVADVDYCGNLVQ